MIKLFKNRTFLLCFTIVFFTIQIWCTATNKNRFPFCTYNMFSKTYYGKYAQYEVLFINTLKDDSVFVPAYKVLPIEFFRVNSIMDNIYANDNSKRQDNFSKLIIETLKNKPWIHFDEIYSSVEFNNFNEIFICVCEFSFDENNDINKDYSIIYSYNLK